jgi:16S rRNA (guanine527-N7)-methyltransferase
MVDSQDATRTLDQTENLGGWLDRIDPYLSEPLSAHQKNQLLVYVRLLREWNQKLNLTAILDDEGIAIRHFQDSLTVIPELRRAKAELASEPDQAASLQGRTLRLADVGSGAGFPGLVLKIACPEIEVVLIDALAKRLRFLDTVIETLGLAGITTVHARAEDAGRQKGLREQFDVVVARAVASLPVLAEYCLPLVRPGGQFIAMKGQLEEELSAASRAIEILGGSPPQVRRFPLPGTDMGRSVVTVCKVRKTPLPYPRKAGKVEQNPLE